MKSWQPSIKLYVVFYVVMLLLSVDGLHSAEIAAKDHGWYMRFIIGVPWMFALIAGIALWVGSKRQGFKAQAAGGIMFVLGFLISAAYDGMGKLAGLIH